jgi:hypothetical protein
MSLIIEIITKGLSPKQKLNKKHSLADLTSPKQKSARMNLYVDLTSPKQKINDDVTVSQMTFILLNSNYDATEIVDIYFDDETDYESKIKALHFLFEKSDTLIGINLDSKIETFRNVLEKYDQKIDLDSKHKICITEKARNIVKKVTRHGVVDPDIEDITIKLFEEPFEDIENSKYTALTIQRICKQLHKEDKLITHKPTLIKQIAKSFRI